MTLMKHGLNAPPRRGAPKPLRFFLLFTMVALVVALGTLEGCAHQYRVQAPNQVGVTDPEGEVVWSFFWGMIYTPPRVDNCNNQALAEVTVKDNLLFSILTVVTLGAVSPKQVEWKCAPPPTTDGTLQPEGVR